MASSEIWDNLDILSTESIIYTYGKRRYTTKFGAILSCLCVSAALAFSLYFLIVYFRKDERSVIPSFKTDFNPYTNLNDYPFLFSFWNQNSDSRVDPRIAKMVITYWELLGNITSVTQINLESCNIEKHFGNYSYLYENFDISNYDCAPIGKYNMTVYGRSAEKKKGYFNFYFAKCMNNSIWHDNRTDCKSPDEIEKSLNSSNHFFTYSMPIYTIDHNDDASPVKLRRSSNQVSVSTSFFYQYLMFLKNGFYESNGGFIFNDRKEYSYHVIDNYAQKVNIFPYRASRVPNSISSVQLTIIEDTAEVFNRSYAKFQSVMASIGGVLNFLIMTGSIIVKYFTHYDYIIEHSERILSLSNKKENRMKFENMMSFKKKDLKSKNKIKFHDGVIKKNENNEGEENNVINNNINNKIKPEKSMLKRFLTFDFRNTSHDLNESNDLINTKRHKYKPPEKLTMTLSVKEMILPIFCLNKNSKRHLWERVNLLIRQVLSTDYLLALINDFYKLKKIILNENQNLIFDSVRNHELEEKEATILEKYNFYQELKEMGVEKKMKISDAIDHLKKNNSEINQRLLKMLNN